MDAFGDKVRSVLSDTMNLPDDFLSMIPQYVAQNPVSLARTPGTRITSGQKTSDVTATGTTFAGGTDVLASPLTFTADGKTAYIVRCASSEWQNDTVAKGCFLSLNLDSADVGYMAIMNAPGAGYAVPLAGVSYIIPSAGSHTVNARLLVNGGTGLIIGGAMPGAGNFSPILVTIEVA